MQNLKRTKLKDRIKNYDLFSQQNPDLYYTYLHYNKDTDEIFYVGKGKDTRCVNQAERNQWWINIVSKHDFYVVIDKINLSEQEAFDREKELIQTYGRKQFGEGGKLVNLTDGGEGATHYIYTEEQRKQRSEYYKNNPEVWQSGENREKYFGKQLFGEDNPNYGNRGEQNPISKKVVKLDMNGNLIAEYGSIIEAAEANNISQSGVSGVCRKERHQVKNMIFRYLDDYQQNGAQITRGVTSKRPVYQLNKIGFKIEAEYESINATTKDGFNAVEVRRVCNHTAKTHKGFYWCFVDDYENYEKEHRAKYKKI